MKVCECMTERVRTVTPDTPIREAARIMGRFDSGILPVQSDDRLVGMVSDRDISVRGVAEGMDPSTPVRKVMTTDVLYCYEDEAVEAVARNMGDIQVRRLPVLNREKRLVGIVALSDLAAGAAPPIIGQALDNISRPGGNHSQRIANAA